MISSSPPGTFRCGSVSSIRSSIQSPRPRLATALSALPTCREPVGLGAKRTLFIRGPVYEPRTACPFPARKISRHPGYARRRGRSTARMVRGERPRPSLAADTGSIRDPRVGGDAAADAGGAGRPALPAVARTLADGRGAGDGAAAAVIREWQGLGYNRRGLNLHRAARQIAAGGWPADLTELPGVGPYTAAAVANFALGRDVLPVDTNVSRIQERTGHQFSAAAGQALMDLGATVCLARIPRCAICPLAGECPSRGRRYEPQRKQSPFEGSFRQRRAQTLRRVAEAKRPLDELDPKAVESLARDGLVQVEPCGKFVTLP